MLTDVQIRAFQPQAQAYRVADGDGLFVNVAPSGERSWVFRYKLVGRSGSIGLGPYPKVGLKVARALRDQARREVTAGRKPRGMREQERIDAAMTVEAMTWAWFEEQKDRWSEHFRQEVRARLMRNVISKIGGLPAEPSADVNDVKRWNHLLGKQSYRRQSLPCPSAILWRGRCVHRSIGRSARQRRPRSYASSNVSIAGGWQRGSDFPGVRT